MDRRVNVNAGTVPAVTPDGLPPGWSQTAWPPAEPIAGGGEYAARGTGLSGQGPCLYLGPGGERCRRPARTSGFCVAHEPKNRTTNPVRVCAAAAAIAALLWPYLELVVREVIGWARSR
jgi:hypothetical protein